MWAYTCLHAGLHLSDGGEIGRLGTSGLVSFTIVDTTVLLLLVLMTATALGTLTDSLRASI